MHQLEDTVFPQRFDARFHIRRILVAKIKWVQQLLKRGRSRGNNSTDTITKPRLTQVYVLNRCCGQHFREKVKQQTKRSTLKAATLELSVLTIRHSVVWTGAQITNPAISGQPVLPPEPRLPHKTTVNRGRAGAVFSKLTPIQSSPHSGQSRQKA